MHQIKMLDFNRDSEEVLLSFIQNHYGAEVFTPGLQRTEVLYSLYKSLVKQYGVKVTIIAGTNGKGQTAHTLTHLLATSGLRVAMWTSPHILSLRERFWLIDKNVSYEMLLKEVLQTHDHLKKEHSELKVSFYEFLFLVFLRLSFLETNGKIDHLVLEVGLGGRLDAVNHFDADCACITSISRDHQSILGNRYELILMEKLAVARNNKPLFSNFHLDYLDKLTKDFCDKNQIIWKNLSNSYKESNYFLENQKLAQAIYCEIEPKRSLDFGMVIPIFKGRREEMTFRGNTLIFIGAHNVDGVRKMIDFFSSDSQCFIPDQVLVSFSKRPIIEIEVMLKSLCNYFEFHSNLLLCDFDHPKAIDRDSLYDVGNKINENQKLNAETNVETNKINKGMLDFVTNWKSKLEELENQRILVCGSYYFIGEVQRFILNSN